MVNNGHKSWLIGDITNQLGIHNRSRRFHIESGLGILLRLLLCLYHVCSTGNCQTRLADPMTMTTLAAE
ncbi:hypothetical protein BCR44DRAFT_1444435 [Catenaria anguillulae PL171]|uniref:Uncharacterized protein n=1 Tax=Catenaria anguillulae PL171 TaxID=765915 RepID=A0A1Y2H7Q2_9FUNG|nr:hypothetical protein BCR44DRAFT_1444435 [Catenaria anguillulae PL171]